MVLVTPDGSVLEQTITLCFKASNNEAEYEAQLASLRMAKDLAVKKLAIHSDSQLITSQTNKKYMAKHPRMSQYLEKVRKQLEAFQTYALTQVPRRFASWLRLHLLSLTQTLYSSGVSRQAKHRSGASSRSVIG